MPELDQDSAPTRLEHVRNYVYSHPWAILEPTLKAIVEFVELHAAGGSFTEAELEARIGKRQPSRPAGNVGNVAVIPVHGVISPRATLFSQISGGTSITGLQSSFRAALADDSVSAIALEIDSPGGLTDLVADFAGEIRAARGQKPIIAHANTMAASAAYWLASQADELIVSPSGSVGAIGVIAAHDDVSAARERMGIKTTTVAAGKHKGALSPYGPLSEEGLALIEERVGDLYTLFVNDVAAGRGVSPEDVRGGFGEGAMVSAQKSIREGMADKVGTFETAVARAAAAGGAAGRSYAVGGFVSSSAVLAQLRAGETVGLEAGAQPIAPHGTATSDGPWDGPANRTRLRNDGDAAYYASAHAWVDPNGNPTAKASYRFIHHEVDADGKVGPANVTACRMGIAVLNGGRGGTTIPAADRKGVYAHLSRHLKDAGIEPPALAMLDTEPSFVDEALGLTEHAQDFVDRLASLAEVGRGRLTVAKREASAACPAALREAADALERVQAATGTEAQDDDFVAELSLDDELAFLSLNT